MKKPIPKVSNNYVLTNSCSYATLRENAKFDSCGVRTHALSEWRLEPPPKTARPNCLERGQDGLFCRRLRSRSHQRQPRSQPPPSGALRSLARRPAAAEAFLSVTAVGFEPTPFRNGAWSHRLRPLGQTVLRSSDRTHITTPGNPKRLFLKEAPTGD